MRQEGAYGPTNAIIMRLVRLVLETNTLTGVSQCSAILGLGSALNISINLAGMAILSVAVFATDPVS